MQEANWGAWIPQVWVSTDRKRRGKLILQNSMQTWCRTGGNCASWSTLSRSDPKPGAAEIVLVRLWNILWNIIYYGI